MLKFKEHLLEAAGKNTHMTHIEDLVIYGGVKGAREAILALRSLRDMLSGSTSKESDLTVKWDGAPAIFAGIDPSDGKFFVAKKGIFNKNPKVYKTHADIDEDIASEGLNHKMTVALDELSKLGIKGVIQGDIMFTQDDLKVETIEGDKYVTFHPNTIVYAVPNDSDQAKVIKKAKIGVVWHTEYKGSDFESMKASFGYDVNKLKSVSSVWSESAEFKDLSGTATLTKSDTDEVTKALSDAGKIFKKIASTTLKQLEGNQKLAQNIETFNNSFVRKNEVITDTKKHVDDLIKFIAVRFQKDIDKLKSEKGKNKKSLQRDEFLEFFSVENKTNLKLIFDLQLSIVAAKKLIMEKLNTLSSINTFIKTKHGYKVAGAEGFVAIDRLKGGAVKLVDRMEFSANNFSPEIIKGWESATRG